MAFASFKGKKILITGAASGIGRATAMAFAREGAHLILTDVTADALSAAGDEARRLGATCETHILNVADEAAQEALAADIHERFGALDILVNNAGIGFFGLFVDTPMSAWRKVFDIDLFGLVKGCQLYLPAMLAKGDERHIVNIASAAGYSQNANLSAYVAAKHAVLGFTDSLAIELHGSPVGVTAICPGIINTNIVKDEVNRSARAAEALSSRMRDFYAKEGSSPDVVAADILDAVRKRREFVPSGKMAGLLYFVKTLSRPLFKSVILKEARKAGYL